MNVKGRRSISPRGRSRASPIDPEKHAVEAERLRIARDLHDYLGASLTEIGMLAENTMRSLGRDARQFSHQIKLKVDAAIAELDSLVWAVDPRHDTLASLAGYLTSFVQEYASNSGLICRVRRDPDWPKCLLSPDLRHSIFLTVREAVNNAVRHGRPDCISLSIHREGKRLRIEIADDGQGFEHKDGQGGQGLLNLGERLTSLGGQCKIESRRGSGTSVCLSVPLPG